MTPLPESLLESVAAAAVREGLADAIFTRLSTPIGRLLVVQGPEGLVRIAFESEPEDHVLAEVAAALGPNVIGSDRELAAERDALSEYFEGDATTLDAARRPAADARAVPARGAGEAARGAARRRPSATASWPRAPATRRPRARSARRARATRSRSSCPATACCPGTGKLGNYARRARSASARCSSSRACCLALLTVTDLMTTWAAGWPVFGSAWMPPIFVDDVHAAR